MKATRKLLGITILFLVLIIVSTIVVYLIDSNGNKTLTTADYKIQINAIEHQIDDGDSKKAIDNLENLNESIDSLSGIKSSKLYLIPLGISAIYVLVVFAYINSSILKPFSKLHTFASEVAAGNLDLPLNQDRGQYFGEFTWAFDSMRKEIKKSRDSERESIENNKTVIATLSHDIKTPISSIRSYSEALEANLDKTPEKRIKYLNTIISKCDEVAKLTDDLFLHSVSDMGKMSVNPVQIDVYEFIKASISNLNTFENISFSSSSDKCLIMADPERLMQICENIVGNANKYAPGKIDIGIDKKEKKIVLSFRDYGKGIPEENLPFITQKFYRGNNVEGIQGSGLGLYIVSYLASTMNAKLIIENVYDSGISTGLRIQIVFDEVI